ncbi:DUF6723 family protein [Paraburkholderia fungorum]|uniref:DUF6723 family protein n=1 Tax=Paraburkholderia fungorum TaxID=134537 RepID=UPI0038BCC71C
MAGSVSRRPQGANPQTATGRANYQVAVSSRRTSGGTVVPTLKVVRLNDERVIYPFQGHADMPFFESADAAQAFAETYGWQLVDGDIAVPE